MNQGSFNFKGNGSNFVLGKGEQKISIWQTIDEDVWLGTNSYEVCLELNSNTRDFHELRVYNLFLEFMQLMIGRYILKDVDDEYTMLPKDFIDLKNKIITWHSDNGNDNILKISYEENSIKVSLIKDCKANNNIVRIRTDGSEYMRYYQEFLNFFRELQRIGDIFRVEEERKDSQVVYPKTSVVCSPTPKVKKLSFNRIFGKSEKNDRN